MLFQEHSAVATGLHLSVLFYKSHICISEHQSLHQKFPSHTHQKNSLTYPTPSWFLYVTHAVLLSERLNFLQESCRLLLIYSRISLPLLWNRLQRELPGLEILKMQKILKAQRQFSTKRRFERCFLCNKACQFPAL